MQTVFSAASLDEMDKANLDTTFYAINSNILTDASKEDVLNGRGHIVSSALQGMMTQGGGKLMEAKAFLDGKTSYSHNLDFLTPQQKTSFSFAINNKIKQEESIAVGLAVGQAKNYVDYVSQSIERNTGGITPAVKYQGEQKLKALDNLKGPKAKEAQNKLENALGDIDVYNRMTLQSAADIQKENLANTVTTRSLAEAGDDHATLVRRRKMKENYLKKIQEDGGCIVRAEASHIPEGTKEFLEYQKTKGTANPQVFSN